ncbi:hypothetical protein [Actinomadura sp. 21ATH]|uniref:hypothetical protein n=1 Tax=Actinomadura sp. 21ATH TaxID=1735444 RepID=UPI0035C0A578
MPATAPEELQIQFMTAVDVPEEEVRHAREVVTRALKHAPRPVLYTKVTLGILNDPAVPRPYLVSIRVDLNGRPVNAYAAGPTMAEAIGLAGSRLRARVEHMAQYWETRRKAPRRTSTPREGGGR